VPSDVAVHLAAIFAHPAGAGACAGDGAGTLHLAIGGPGAKIVCTADCNPYTDVTCSGSGMCTAVDRNCAAGQRGYVTCNGVTTPCPGPECEDSCEGLIGPCYGCCATDDCFACCKCGGGSGHSCAEACYG
jgi:hypothetical protein